MVSRKRKNKHERLMEVLNSPVVIEGVKKFGEVAVVLAPMWGWIVLHPIAWEVDKKYPSTGLTFNALYATWVATEVLSKLGGISAIMGLATLKGTQ